MKENYHPSQFDQEPIKPKDWLPDGTDDKKHTLRVDDEWHGLEKRLGKPRILNHIYFPEVLNWIQEKYSNDPDSFSYFEAGCGHGNDLRAIKKELKGKGHFFGVDLSEEEINHGIKFYHQQDNENIEESRKLFAQGDLRNLRHINIWDDQKESFSKQTEIKDDQFDLLYIEAVLHGFGHSKKTYHEKKESAQKALNELYRVCKKGGKFFGRSSTFDPTTTEEQRLAILRNTDNWRFIPEHNELEEMIKRAGFVNIKTSLMPHEKSKEDPAKKNILRFSFLAEK